MIFIYDIIKNVTRDDLINFENLCFAKKWRLANKKARNWRHKRGRKLHLPVTAQVAHLQLLICRVEFRASSSIEAVFDDLKALRRCTVARRPIFSHKSRFS